MSGIKKIRSALVSVYHKEGLTPIVSKLNQLGVKIYSTGGTKSFIEEQKIPVTSVESLTSYPSILGGRVKTLHPLVFGGILSRRGHSGDQKENKAYNIPEIDLVIVDLYPFEQTVSSDASEAEVIEQIDIGGISLIRAAAKNYKDVLIVSHRSQYAQLLDILEKSGSQTKLDERRDFAHYAFHISSHYDTAIFNYFDNEGQISLKQSIEGSKALRYGENPHQNGRFYGQLDEMLEQLHGKEISYNNLLDIDAAVNLISEFDDCTLAILKHNNACGLASRNKLADAWTDALAGDPISAFGGIIITNRKIDKETAEGMNKIFFEVAIAPSYDEEALEILKQKKKRILLIQKPGKLQNKLLRSILNGTLAQDRDTKTETAAELSVAGTAKPGKDAVEDMLFANTIVKHTKSNAIVLAKNKQLLGSGTGQTSRVDALKQAIEKARSFDFDLSGAVMASDAFFPFADSVEIAHKAGIRHVIQPGGSVRDKDSTDYCDQNGMTMIHTGTRHFKH
jgi:phosphoribosylaminoimidazolecarboxamide formyltransferase / IMP cyclohydrolase